MKRCKKCIVTDTRPNIKFDDNGVCYPCNYIEERKSWDFDKLKEEFISIIYRNKVHSRYDCIVAVSGGKDSYYMVKTLTDWGLSPLCISIRPLIPTEIGIKNLNNMIKVFEVDLIQLTLGGHDWNEKSRNAFLTTGNCFQVWIDEIFGSVQSFAKLLKIPLVIYGENGNAFYGGNPKRTVIEEHISIDGIIALNLSDYVPWSSTENIRIAKEHGFKESDTFMVGGFTRTCSMDDIIDELYLWFTYPKFGYGNATKYGAQFVRDGALKRYDAEQYARIYDGEFPFENIEIIMEYLGITMEELITTIRKFTKYHKDKIELIIARLENYG